MRRRTATRFLAATAVLAGLIAAGTASNADGPRPGLPAPPPTEPGTFAGWDHVIQGGAAETTKAKQWARVPMQVTTVYTVQKPVKPNPCSPCSGRTEAINYLYLMAEASATHSYGQTAPFTVRTAALGSVPVEATLRLAQQWGSDELPIPMVVSAFDDHYWEPDKPADWPFWAKNRKFHDTEVNERVAVIIEALRVDGVDLQLRPGCTTAEPATLDLLGKGYIEGDPSVNKTPPLSDHYAPGAGGYLSGTIDVPAFAHCRTASGEDISPLLTATVSGPDNAVALSVSQVFLNCVTDLPPVGAYDAPALCPGKLPGSVSLPPSAN